MFELLKCGQQIRHRSAPPIQAPHQHHVDFPPARRFQQSLSCLPPGRTGADLTHLESDHPTTTAGILAHGPVLHHESLLIIGGNAGIQPRTKHFRPCASLAKNVVRFCFLRGPFYGHCKKPVLPGRSRSFSARTTHHITRRPTSPAAPTSRGSSRASIPREFVSTLPRASATR